MVLIGRRNKLERAAQDALARAEAAGAAQPASSGSRRRPGGTRKPPVPGARCDRSFISPSASWRFQPPVERSDLGVGLNPVSALHFWSCGERGIGAPPALTRSRVST